MSDPTAADAAAADVVDELAALPLRTLVERLCGLEATLAAGGAISNVLREAARAKMTATWRAEHVAPTGRAPGLGTVSLTLPQQKVTIDDMDAFASWLAERHPSEVDATITLRVPATQLPAILAVIEADLLSPEIVEQLAGPDPADATEDELAAIALGRALRDRVVSLAPKGQFAKVLLEQRCTVMPGGVDEAGAAYPAAVFGEDGSVVDGVKVIPGADPTALDAEGNPTGPQPTSISVRLEGEAKARAVAAAAAQFAALVQGQPAVLAIDGSLAGGNPEPDPPLAGVGQPGELAGEWQPEDADAEPSYDDEPDCGGPAATCHHPEGYFDDEAIAPDAPAIDVIGLQAWRAMRKPQLQAECRRLELDDTGTVADLRGRLGNWAASTAGMPA